MTEPMMRDPSEADVKAAEEIEWMLSSYSDTDTTEDEQRIKAENIMVLSRALASARFEGSCEMLDRLRNSLKFWPEDGCDIGIATEVSRLLASARGEGEAAGLERAAKWCEGRKATYSEFYAKSLRALTPEGKR